MSEDNFKKANEDYKVAKAKAKALRPWYKKKRIIIPLVIFVLIAFTAMGSSESSEETSTVQPSASTNEEEKVNEVEKVEEETGPQLTEKQKNAVRSAKSYLEFSAFSRQGIIDQLSSEYGDQFSVEDATVAVDSLNTDYNEQAKKSAKSYIDMRGFSCQGLIDQLSSQYADKYTAEQAKIGAEAVGAC